MMRKIDFNEDFFSTDCERSFYWAGFLAADGCLSERIQVCRGSRTHIKSVELKLSEREPVELFLFDVGCVGRKIYEQKYETQKGTRTKYGIGLKSHQMFDDLHRFGLTPRKSKTFKMPKWVERHELVNHFVRGYFDGDGSVFSQRGQIYIEFRGTVSFLVSLNRVVKRSGLKTQAVPHIHSGCGSLKYAGNNKTRHVAEFMYRDSNVWLDRKRNKFGC